ncbi:hypothetical protein SAY86_009826 [Trapa natans]|uniref:Receptor-like serine/threonine-protein kinase n=1 Tax=Trapa natans TaxID=22666 RepID=A0AAN7L581_TRANT|nr:hypothetical protein SAY86_009826 [Trapa natans]
MLHTCRKCSSFALLAISYYASMLSAATDSILTSLSLQDPESIVSNGNVFRMGFFTPNGSSNRYVGIWYDGYPDLNILWVANRGKPIKDSPGMMMISEDGNLVIMDSKKTLLWSTNVTNSGRSNVTAQLLDTGNLVLLRSNSTHSGEIAWQSFENLSDSFTPEMKLSSNARTNFTLSLTSWRSRSDPAPGTFSAGINPLTIPEIFVWNGTEPYWRSSPWIGQIVFGFPLLKTFTRNGFTVEVDDDGTYSFSFSSTVGRILYYVLEPNGTLLQVYSGKEEGKGRGVSWSSHEYECDVYSKCGPFGVCDPSKSPICTCPRGFVPGDLDEWNRGNWTGGCVRKTPTNCGSSNSSTEDDGFLRLEKIKVPAYPEWSSSSKDECRNRCSSNCSCLAYAFDEGVGCMSWTGGGLLDMLKRPNAVVDVYIRLPSQELGEDGDSKVILAVTLSSGAIFIALSALFIWMRMKKRRGVMMSQKAILFPHPEDTDKITEDGDTLIPENFKFQDLKLLSFEELSRATDSFSSSCKLGQGGFGPVYRAKLVDGQEVAVKRLSRASGQGLVEFMNEVAVISKVQHRNLVRLLGCCVEREEKILVYEFMANKSLDAFLFVPLKQRELNWSQRFKIIEGICRGLIYLHRDSRLRIIHRDLKASNILLDEELNPKISDFGMARIFGTKEDEANTRRVVGTLGYMAPEYAMEGVFSEKSDVYSFGVLLLEIISGRRSTSFKHDDDLHGSLLGFAWKVFNEGDVMALVDPAISESAHQAEVRRCIHVGLLCTQELAKDRPTVSTAISMLNSEIEIAHLPRPKQPLFMDRELTHDINPSVWSGGVRSINNVTVTRVEGR